VKMRSSPNTSSHWLEALRLPHPVNKQTLVNIVLLFYSLTYSQNIPLFSVLICSKSE